MNGYDRRRACPARPARRKILLLGLSLVAMFFTCAVSLESAAQQPLQDDAVRVGLYASPPFVNRDDDEFSGMAVDLWERLASRLTLQYDYTEFDTLGDLLIETVAGRIDVAVTNLTITQKRAQQIDFTQPWFDAGLRIMVEENRGTGFSDILRGLQQSGHLRAYVWLVLVILVATVMLTLFDRRFDKGFPKRWRDGFAESFYAVMSVATSGKMSSRKNLFGWMGRIWQALWLVCGIAVIAYVTSSITSVMTTLSLSNQINGPNDLQGRNVGVFTGSVAEDFVRASSMRAVSYSNIDKAAEGLRRRRIAAIVGDAPVLEYFAHTHQEMPLNVVGAIFHPDKYAFGLPHRSALTHPLTVQLLGAHEDGFVEQLRSKYFGSAE